ncbi:kynureninase [bacterium]|nr:kynureninase [bacterium]
MIFNNSRELALELDNKDPLLSYNDKFHFPVQENGNKHIYLCGNSLGLQAKITESFVKQELDDWKALGVEGHFHAQNPWLPYHEFLSESYSKIVGSKKSEVIAMNTLSVNLHLMMVSFYRPNETKNKIIIEGDAFPSDIYAVESHMKHHGIDPSESLIKLRPREGEVIIRLEDIINVIEQNSESVSLIMLGGVNYYTGQLFDMKKITQVSHNHGILVGFDLAHAVGNVLLLLHDWNVDFAVWCSYKYLNSGPGSVAGAFIHERHHKKNLERFAGWWGHDKESRFKMPDQFQPIQTAEGWQLSNPSILSLAAVRASLSLFDEVGMSQLITKSKNLTSYLVFLLNQIPTDRINIITPEQRGCQISISVKNGNKDLFNEITKRGVIADWREPDVIRVAPVPLYNSYLDVYNFYQVLKEIL